MKVGILTFHSSYNFGANLQALAVQELFRSKGCQSVVIDYRDPWKTEILRSQVPPAQAEMHERFVRRYLCTSPLFEDAREVQEYCNDQLDVVVVGSDQVFRLLSRWEPKALLRFLRGRGTLSSWSRASGHLPVYYLPWPKNESTGPRRIAIAACATGMSYFFLGRTLRREARRALCDFDFISVRDSWTSVVVAWLSAGRVKPVLCPDPVFALNEHFSIPRDESPDIDVSRVILMAAPFEKSWLDEFRNICRERGLTIAHLPDTTGPIVADDDSLVITSPLSPLTWYSLLSQAAGYVGSRFHGLVSCVANRTPVVTVDWSNKPRLLKSAVRTYDLCRKAGAPNRYMAVNWLVHPKPEVFMENLMDEQSQAAMNHYGEQAKVRIGRVVDEGLRDVS